MLYNAWTVSAYLVQSFGLLKIDILTGIIKDIKTLYMHTVMSNVCVSWGMHTIMSIVGVRCDKYLE